MEYKSTFCWEGGLPFKYIILQWLGYLADTFIHTDQIYSGIICVLPGYGIHDHGGPWIPAEQQETGIKDTPNSWGDLLTGNEWLFHFLETDLDSWK